MLTVLVVAELGNQGVFILRLLERRGALDMENPLAPATTATKTAEEYSILWLVVRSDFFINQARQIFQARKSISEVKLTYLTTTLR
jgi:hypothetical protein